MNPPIRVKICGITCREDAEAAIDAGADALGFNLYPGSKRLVLLRDLLPWIPLLDGVLRVGVMVNPASIMDIRNAQPYFDVIQLHGREAPGLCAQALETGAIWKAFSLSADFDPEIASSFPSSAFVIDSAVPGAFGGTGVLADLDRASQFVRANGDRPVWLSGGLNPGNVAEAVERVRPFGVDVASGVEVSGNPRRKDAALVRAFISAARRAGEKPEKRSGD